MTASPRKTRRTPAAPATQLNLFDVVAQLFSAENQKLGGYDGTVLVPVQPGLSPLMATFTGYVPGEERLTPPSGTVSRLKAMMSAIETLRSVQATPGSLTPMQQAQLVGYPGWGSLAECWNGENYAQLQARQVAGPEWDANVYEEPSLTRWLKTYGESRLLLDTILTDDEKTEAEKSTVNAFYTSPEIITTMWQVIEKFGFTGGNVLEPASGTGHFIGLMPSHLRANSQVSAAEKDLVSAQILGLLYPEVRLHSGPFETAPFETGSQDLVIGNVPFGDYKVYDRQYKDLSAHKIHNYFIGKSARLLKPNGLLALITTAGTLDSVGKAFRQVLTGEKMELAGAIRLPSCTFEKHAGTEVTTDMLFMQKRSDTRRLFALNSFTLSLPRLSAMASPLTGEEDTEARTLNVNEYYGERPAMMLGEMVFADEVNKGGLYRSDRGTCFLADPNELATRLRTAIDALPRQLTGQSQPGSQPRNPAPASVNSTPVKFNGRTYKTSTVLGDCQGLQDAFFAVLQAEQKNRPDEICEPLRATLRSQYQRFVLYYGQLNKNRTLNKIDEFDGFSVLQALEVVTAQEDPAGKPLTVITPSDILTRRVFASVRIPETVATIGDALQLSLYKTGGIDLDFMATLRESSPALMRDELLTSESAYLDPETGQLIDARSYLSGDVRAKRQTAQYYAIEAPQYLTNVRALEAVVPAPIPIALIGFQLGSSWLPVGLIEDFMADTLDIRPVVSYNGVAGAFDLDYSRTSPYSVKNNSLGTKARKATDLIEAALNSRSVIVTKTIQVGGESKEVRDIDATAEAVQAQEALQELFTDYAREHYADAIEHLFNERYNSVVLKNYPVPALTHYEGANPAITLRQHQKSGVERIKEQDTMFAHSVGSGKTFTLITGVMELKRLGITSKAIITVQNSTVSDFARAWKTLYPSALVYVPTKADLEAKNRRRFLQRIATNEFDGIILPNSFLKLIPDDPTDVDALTGEEIQRVKAKQKLSGKGQQSRSAKKTVKQLNSAILRIESRRNRQGDRKTDAMLHFGQLGVDFLAIDEAHSKKRLGFETNRRGIKGIDNQGSQDAMQAMTKCRTIQRRGGRVVLATGTPISNTMAEAWTMLRYIAPDALNRYGIGSFDEFAGTFGQIIPSFELTTTGQFKAVDRFARFINVGQLSTLYRTHVDVVLNDDIAEFKTDNTLPWLNNDEYTRVILPQTDGIAEELCAIREELKRFESLSGDEKKANCHIPLVMFGQARKATLDIRLLNVDNPDEEGSKLNHAARTILNLYRQSQAYNGTQLVFSDLYQSPKATEPYLDDDEYFINPNYGKPRFNLFENLKEKLIAGGIPTHEIAIVPADPKKREAIFEQVRSGAIRVMLGSSERMGVGVNVQERLVAVHHLDAPARPTDFEQRNGRLIRQGNLHAVWSLPVHVFTYGVDKTLDATAYGRLAIKQKFINQVLRGNIDSGVVSDVSTDDDFAAMSFDQMMATLSGSQYALRYTAKNHELTRLHNQLKTHQRGLIDAQRFVERAKGQINHYTAQLSQLDLESELVALKFPVDADGKRTIDAVTVESIPYASDWGKAVEEYCQQLKRKARTGRSATGSLTVNGITLRLEGVLVDYDADGRAIMGVRYSWGLSMTGCVTAGAGLFTSLRTTLRNVTDAPENARREIAHQQEVLTVYGQKVNVPFKREQELKDLTVEVEQLKLDMARENQPEREPIQTNSLSQDQ